MVNQKKEKIIFKDFVETYCNIELDNKYFEIAKKRINTEKETIVKI